VKVVHLAFEDHRRPGSGGGGLRTFEINRRLAEFHDITVVTARYPGARRRVEEGVVYRPLGWNLGYFGSVVTYFLLLPFFVAVQRADLIVEDFAAPISSALVPLFTRVPTVAVVQWLFARERSRHYHLPLFLLEKLGVRLHRRFVAVSSYIAEQLRAANQQARIDVVPAGVATPPDMGLTDVTSGRVLYLGRLEWAPKGLDLLLECFGQLTAMPEVRLVLAGEGPDGVRVREAARHSGVGDRVDMLGWVSGPAKWKLLASAAVVVIPSRHESFGLVAAEASSIGTPVVAFDLPSLREILADAGGLLVTPYDTAALAAALERVLTDPLLRAMLAEQGRRQADRFDWDLAALAHDRVYRAAVGEGR
jgi:glycosyltransferase involved in cell wall biosynthesis